MASGKPSTCRQAHEKRVNTSFTILLSLELAYPASIRNTSYLSQHAVVDVTVSHHLLQAVQGRARLGKGQHVTTVCCNSCCQRTTLALLLSQANLKGVKYLSAATMTSLSEGGGIGESAFTCSMAEE